MKIFHIISGLGPGGAEHMLCRLAGAMTDARHLVYSVSGNGVMSEPLRAAGATILNDDQRGTARNLASLRRHMARQAPDIVQGWMYHGNAVSIPSLLMSPKSKLFWNIRQSLTDMKHVKASTRFIIRSQALLSRVPSGIIYNAMSAALDHEKIGFSEKRRVIIPNGFDCNKFKPDDAARTKIRAELGLDHDRTVIGLVARHDSWKNHEGFFRMAANLLERYPDLAFVLAGHGIEWSNPALSSLIQGERLRQSVHLLGDRRDVAAVNAALDIACNVSHGEGFPNAVGEAMACGIPCIVTPVGASPDLVDDDQLIARSTKDHDLIETMDRLLLAPPGERRAIGAVGRSRILKHFSIDAVARRYLDLYSASGDRQVHAAL